MTIQLCLERCYGYQWAGVEFGRECWCGNKLQLDTKAGTAKGAMNTTEAECNFRCPGDESVYCGARVRLSLYSHREATMPRQMG